MTLTREQELRVHQRTEIKQRVERMIEVVNAFQIGDDIGSIKARLDTARSAFREFSEIQVKIIEKSANLEDETREQIAFEEIYYNTVAKLESVLEAHNDAKLLRNANIVNTPHNNDNIQNNGNHAFNNQTKLNLPSIQIPQFNGNYENWLSFRDLYKSLIHENTHLRNIEKMHYLRTCLVGEALRTIESLTVSDANYISAWNLLQKRFENQRLIVFSHVRKIVNSPAIGKGNFNNLRQLIDEVVINVESLKLLDIPVDYWDAILVPIIMDKLDFHSNREWQSKLTNELPTLDQLIEFLRSRCNYLESITHNSSNNKQNNSGFNSTKTQNKFNKTQSIVNLSTNNKKHFNCCAFCKRANHNVHQCTNFLKLKIPDRVKEVQNLKLCKNCLRNNHEKDQCPSNSTCRECGQKHNTLLHVTNNTNFNIDKNEPSTSTVNHCGLLHSSSQILLSTAVVFIKDHRGIFQKCRALLDNASQSNFITNNLCQRLGLKTDTINHEVRGIGKQQSFTSQKAKISIKSLYNDYKSDINCAVLSEITDALPVCSFPVNKLQIPANIQLADTKFNISDKIDLLIGAELFLELLLDGKIQLKSSKLFLQNTQLGYILGGILNLNNNSSTSVCNLAVNQDISKQIERFWQVENFQNSVIPQPSVEDKQIENHFITTTKRDADGRFVVNLPLTNNPLQLGNSKIQTMKRFANLEKKLSKNPGHKLEYTDCLHEYLSLGHMTQIPNSEIDKENANYLPHHSVFKETIAGSKIRVVFDASMKTSNGLSLNDNLAVGPTIQQDLFSIIVRFRTHEYVLTGDIVKMYRQIKICQEHADLQRIFWRDNPSDILQIFKLNTLTFGTASAPFLAVRCLHQLAYENMDRYPVTCNIILRDFYLDDVLTGDNDLDTLFQIKNELIQILQSGGFELTKWASNEDHLLKQSEVQISLNKEGETKTLGLFWNSATDVLKYQVKSISSPPKLTKRIILSTISCIFDPLGIVSPVIIKTKILMQQLWLRNLEWDEAVPADIYQTWSNLMYDIKNLSQLQIPRKALVKNFQRIELHAFADASEKGYGAAIYLKSTDDKGESNISLLVAKSRVAPIKVQTIPRLELLAAQLSAQLTDRVVKILDKTIDQFYFWTDSQIVLAWISKPANHWQVFVANRVSNIQNLSNIHDWRHVASGDNPADIISRGCSAEDLSNNKLWWQGPSWLLNSSYESLTTDITNNFKLNEVPDKRKTTISLATVTNFDIISRFSDFSRLRRVVAYMLRFLKNCRNPLRSKNESYLTYQELKDADTRIISEVQKQSFAQEVKDLRDGKNVNKNSKLINLNPFLDSDGIIRVGGRLTQSKLTFNQKHPIVLPKNNQLTHLIIKYYHCKMLHAGAQATLAALRQVYWPIAGKDQTRKIIHKCISCFKARPTIVHQKMGDLPMERLEPARPFTNTGVDYCGPIMIKEGRGRGKKSVKSYICLFVCLSSKAVHLELVCDLSSDSFMNALKRLMSRRGSIKHFRSDNATNFTASNKELKNLADFFRSNEFQNTIITQLENENIKWSFSPPRAPNFGGLMEAAVKSVKFHLKRIIGETLLTYEEMYTFLTRIEACLNSRPLIPLSTDPNDFTALTPGHLLIGEPLTAPLEHDLRELKLNRLSRFQLLERMRQHFWDRWRKEYVAQLQGRNKWKTSAKKSLRTGTLVLVHEDNAPPMCWPLGRVEEVHPGRDDVVRVVTIKTNKGTYRRSVSKICPLPIDDEAV